MMATTMATRHAAARPGTPRSRRPGASRRRTKQRLTILTYMAPALVGIVAFFVYALKPGTGPVNMVLAKFGIEGPQWFNDPAWAKPSLTLLSLWGIGNTMVIFLAALLDVPVSLHEAAALDGANAWQRFRHVTL